MLLLRCLGQFQIEQDGQPLVLPTRKTAALLTYLALHPEVHARERLVTLFWGDSGDEQARRSLRTALSTLRKTLGEDCVLADRETVQFNPHYPLWIDAGVLRSQAERLLKQPSTDPNLVDLTLYRGDLLEGFYDEWILRAREELRLLYLRLLLWLVQHWRTQGDYAQAIESAQRMLALDPAEEAAHQHLIFCYTASGDRNAARQQYEACVRALREELDVEPAPETVSLYRRSQQSSVRAHAAAAIYSNLPIPLASFIGRQHEIAKLKSLLIGNPKTSLHAPARLVTVTGPGGCGKTRLVIQVARELLDVYADGVWWVDLAALNEDAQVSQAVAKVLDVQQGVQPSLTDVLISHLRTKQMLLVLDNCEHLVAACATLAEQLLSYCPHLQILATSREALGIFGETSWLVPSLSLPAAQQNSPGELLQFEGIRLFVERASAVRRDFALTVVNAPIVLQLCRQLDGIPLAIELAAVRVKLMTVAQIAERLTSFIGARFDLLTGGGRTVLPRQQTLYATMEWSYDLLSEAERVLLRRLSIFAGSFTLAAIEHVCDLHSTALLNLIASLVNKSLVVVERDVDGMTYRLLETIREYAGEKLLASGEEGQLKESHLNFFMQFAETAETQLYGTVQQQWLARLERAHDNIRIALGWAIAQGKGAEALRLSGVMGRFWHVHGYWHEGRQWLEQALSIRDEVALDLPAEANLHSWRARAFFRVGILAWGQCDFTTAHERLEQGLTCYRALGDRHGVSDVLDVLGGIRFEQGEYAAARTIYQESLVVRREIGNKERIGSSLFTLGLVEFHLEAHVTARMLLEESLKLLRESGHKLGITFALNTLGNIANQQGEYAVAQMRYAETLALRRELGDKRGVAATLNDMANLKIKQREYSAAKAFYAESLTLFRDLGNQRGIACSLSGLARIRQTQGHFHLSAKLLGTVDALLIAMNTRFDEPEHSDRSQAIVLLRTQLDSVSFNRAWQEGRSLTMEQAITLAQEGE